MTDDFTFKKTARRIKRNHEIARQTGDLSILKGDAEPHYHHAYNGNPVMNHKFETIGKAFKAVRNMADKSEPNVTYFEEGPVMLEAKIQGARGLHRIMVTVVECHMRCNRILHPELQKKAGWLP